MNLSAACWCNVGATASMPAYWPWQKALHLKARIASSHNKAAECRIRLWTKPWYAVAVVTDADSAASFRLSAIAFLCRGFAVLCARCAPRFVGIIQVAIKCDLINKIFMTLNNANVGRDQETHPNYPTF